MYCNNCMKEIDDNSIYCPFCNATVKDNCAPHHLKPGTVLNNRYLVGNSIGEGGFGITYIGRDLKLECKIAVKEFYPSGYANRNNTLSNEVTLNYQNEGEYFKTGVENFLREAKSIAKFNNESSIVDVRDFFEENGTAYIIMEYLEGENLSEKLKRDGKFEPEQIFRLFLPMMDTLDKMHHENIIHRDISPENIRIQPNGDLMLMDFGSARYYTGMEKKTMSVQFKPGYAPFEQYNKKGNQGPWTDVYSLCATIYKCVTGVAPVDALERVQTDTLKKPSELGAHIPKPLENVIMYGMAIYPENRCQSMLELKQLTEQALGGTNTVFIGKNNSALPKGVKAPATSYNNRTMPADRTYGDTGMFYSEGNKNKQGRPNPENNSKKPFIIGILAAAAVLILAAVIFAILYFNEKNNDSSIQPSATAYEATTAEITTQQVTAQPTQPPTEKSTESPTTMPVQSSEAVVQPEPTVYETSEISELSPQEITPEVPYLIRVKPVTVIYNEPSYYSGVSMTLDEENVYTIVDERVVDGKLWGKFKSGVGWVCLNDIWLNGGSLEE